MSESKHKLNKTEYMRVACNECPFRKDSMRGWLADYTPEGLHNLVMSEVQFPCHMLMGDENIEFEDAELYEPCTGAIRYMKQAGKVPRNYKLAAIVKQATDVEDILTPQEFIVHHRPFE